MRNSKCLLGHTPKLLRKGWMLLQHLMKVVVRQAQDFRKGSRGS